MLNEQTLNQLRALRLDGMVAALSDAATHITASELPFEQRLALLVARRVKMSHEVQSKSEPLFRKVRPFLREGPPCFRRISG
jgi:hypothetical protein